MSDSDRFSVRVVGAQIWDPDRDNIDIEVQLEDGRRFGATFFTLRSIARVIEKNRNTGECARGLYHWTANMIVVSELSLDAIRRTVRDLIETEEFEQAFAFLEDS
jgi:hypothetical protein